MNDQFMKQAEEMIHAAGDVRFPESFQAMTEDSVAKTREAYTRMSSVAQDTQKAFEEVSETAQKGAKTLTEHMMDNFAANTEAALDAAQAVARCQSLPEAAKVQADFVQQQIAKSGEQTREFYELSTKVAKSTMDSLNSVTTKTFEQMKAQG